VTIDDDRVARLLSPSWEDGICSEVRAVSVWIRAGSQEQAGGGAGLEQDWDVEGVPMVIGVSKAADKFDEE
jgi:hypothetical protein